MGDEMTEKLSARLFYALVLSIIVLMSGFVALGIRAFASAVISDSIYLGVFGILLTIFPIYFVLRRPVGVTAMDRKIRGLLSARSRQAPRQVAPRLKDRRKPLVQGQIRTAVAYERRSKQGARFSVVSLEPVAGGTVRG
jgi:hypothetical protein